jgi:hypothetical protein
MNATPDSSPTKTSSHSPAPAKGNGAAEFALVDDVDTGPNIQPTDETEAKRRKRRFNLEADALGPEQPAIEEPTESFTLDFGPPNQLLWFRVDPRPGRSETVTLLKAIPPGGTRPKLFYVPKAARAIAELRERWRHYTVHVTQDRFGRIALWPRRQPRDFANGAKDTWAATDAEVAQCAKTDWIRREPDPNSRTGGYRAVYRPPGCEEIPLKPWDDRPLEELMELAIPEEDVITDDSHPLVVFLRTGKVIQPKRASDD